MNKLALILALISLGSSGANACSLEVDGKLLPSIPLAPGQITFADVDGGQMMAVICEPANATIQGIKRVAHLRPNSCIVTVNKGITSVVECKSDQSSQSKSGSRFTGKDLAQSGLFNCPHVADFEFAKSDALNQCAKAGYAISECYEVSRKGDGTHGFCGVQSVTVIVEGRRK